MLSIIIVVVNSLEHSISETFCVFELFVYNADQIDSFLLIWKTSCSHLLDFTPGFVVLLLSSLSESSYYFLFIYFSFKIQIIAEIT